MQCNTKDSADASDAKPSAPCLQRPTPSRAAGLSSRRAALRYPTPGAKFACSATSQTLQRQAKLRPWRPSRR
eukprot:11345213-Alexandrium_andersonii.AAC.1